MGLSVAPPNELSAELLLLVVKKTKDYNSLCVLVRDASHEIAAAAKEADRIATLQLSMGLSVAPQNELSAELLLLLLKNGLQFTLRCCAGRVG